MSEKNAGKNFLQKKMQNQNSKMPTDTSIRPIPTSNSVLAIPADESRAKALISEIMPLKTRVAAVTKKANTREKIIATIDMKIPNNVHISGRPTGIAKRARIITNATLPGSCVHDFF